MVEKSQTQFSDTYYVNDNALDGHNDNQLPVNLVGESRVPDNIFQAYILSAASINVSFVGRVDISSGYFGGSYHLSGKNVNEFDNAVNNFNYIDNTTNSVKSNLFSGVNINYFPQDSSFSQFKKPNGNSNENFQTMSHRMNVYGRSLPNSTLSPKSVLVEVTKVYATLPIAGLEDVCSTHSRVNELTNDEINNSHNFIKDNNLGIRNGDDEENLKKFFNMNSIDQNEILKEVKNLKQEDRKDHIISKIMGFNKKKNNS